MKQGQLDLVKSLVLLVIVALVSLGLYQFFSAGSQEQINGIRNCTELARIAAPGVANAVCMQGPGCADWQPSEGHYFQAAPGKGYGCEDPAPYCCMELRGG